MTGKDFLFPEFWAALPAILLSAFITFSPPSWLICRNLHSAINAVSYGRLGALRTRHFPQSYTRSKARVNRELCQGLG